MSDDAPQLEPLALERLLRADAEHKNARLEVALELVRWELESLRHAQRLAALNAAADAANGRFLQVARTIEKEHAIDLSQWAYQPETGALARIGGD